MATTNKNKSGINTNVVRQSRSDLTEIVKIINGTHIYNITKEM